MMGLFLWMWYGIVLLLLPLCNGRINAVVNNNRQRLRSMAATETISTADCNNAPVGSYHARLDLYYFYLLEYKEGIDLDLRSIGVAIGTELIKALNQCDEYDRPKFAVSIAPSAHVLSDGDGICEAVTDGNVCRVARGTASVLLPVDGDIIDVEELGYLIVQRVLDDTIFLKDYTGMPLIRSEFVRPIGTNLVFLPSNSSEDSEAPFVPDGATWKIALAAAFISFIVTSIFVYGVYRKRKAAAGNLAMKARWAHIQNKRRQYFHELEGEDTSHEPGWMTTDLSELPREPSITWSVSDLTSDSQSIRSSLPMDRIAEEHDEEIASNPSNSPASKGDPQSSLAEQHLHFICHWKDATTAEDAASDYVCCGRHSPTPGDDLPYQSEDEITPVHRNGVEEYDATTPMSPCGIRYLEDSMEEAIDTSCLVDADQECDKNSSTDNNVTDQTNDSDALRAVLRLPRGPDLEAMAANLSLSDDSTEDGEYDFAGSSQQGPSTDQQPTVDSDQDTSEFGPVVLGEITNQVLSLNGEVLGEHFVGSPEDQSIPKQNDDLVERSSDDDEDDYKDDDDEESSTVALVRDQRADPVAVVLPVDASPFKTETVISTASDAAAVEVINICTEIRSGEEVSLSEEDDDDHGNSSSDGDDDDEEDYKDDDDDEESSTVTQVRDQRADPVAVVLPVDASPFKTETVISTASDAAAVEVINICNEVRLGEEVSLSEEDDDDHGNGSSDGDDDDDDDSGLIVESLEELQPDHTRGSSSSSSCCQESEEKLLLVLNEEQKNGNNNNENADNINNAVYDNDDFDDNDDINDTNNDTKEMQQWVESVLTQLDQSQNVKRISM